MNNAYKSDLVGRILLQIVCVATILLLSAETQAQVSTLYPPMPGTQQTTCANMESSRLVPCPGSVMFFSEGQALAQGAFYGGKFEELDNLYSKWCSGKDRFPDGSWKLVEFGRGLDNLISSWETWSKHLEVIKKWQQARPDSAAARYIEAVYWHTYAWKARGTGYADTVSREGWEIFHERLEKSKEILDKLISEKPTCPSPYVLVLHVMTELGASESQFRSAYSDGIKRYPEYHNIYFAMARHYEPKWGGSIQQYEKFANEVVELTKSFEGLGMYARIYWLVDNHKGIPFKGENSGSPSWAKLKKGYEDLMRLYPSSMHNLGKFVGVVCRSNDSALYRKLRPKIVGYENDAEMLDPIDVCDRRHHWNPTKQ